VNQETYENLMRIAQKRLKQATYHGVGSRAEAALEIVKLREAMNSAHQPTTPPEAE
jgi:hypothetical protein